MIRGSQPTATGFGREDVIIPVVVDEALAPLIPAADAAAVEDKLSALLLSAIPSIGSSTGKAEPEAGGRAELAAERVRHRVRQLLGDLEAL